MSTTRFDTFGHCELASIKPDKNRWRFYRIEVMAGLFAIILSRAWGRIGCSVTVREDFFEDIETALKHANSIYSIRMRHGYREVKSIRAPELLLANHPIHAEESRGTNRQEIT